MIYTDDVKKHWIGKVEELGYLFDPDCGDVLCSDISGCGAPYNVLVNLDGSQAWTTFEKEFQLPRWMLEFMCDMIHDYRPEDSAELLLEFFTAIPTYTDLERVRHKFSIKVIQRLQRECGLQFSRLWNQVEHDSAPCLATVTGRSLTEHLKCIANPKYEFNVTQANKALALLSCDIMLYLNSAEGAGCDIVSSLGEGSTYSIGQRYAECRKDVGNPLAEDNRTHMNDLYQDLISVLKEVSEEEGYGNKEL